MLAAVLLDRNRLEVCEVETPGVEEGEVLIEVELCGICGTDLHSINGDNKAVRLPAVLGHEIVGKVVKVGAAVGQLKVGDKVAVDPSRSCGVCDECRNGHPNICQYKGGYGSRYWGGWAQQVAVSATSCFKVPEGMSWRRAVLAEPLACVLHGFDRVGAVLGRTVCIVGAGAVGALAAATFANAGGVVTVVEPNSRRRDVVSSWGFRTLQELPSQSSPECEEFDVVIDATGVPAAIERGIWSVARGGTFLLLGVTSPIARVSISSHRIFSHELTILGSLAINNTFNRALSFLNEVRYPIEDLVDGIYPLERAHSAIQAFSMAKGTKVALNPRSSTAGVVEDEA